MCMKWKTSEQESSSRPPACRPPPSQVPGNALPSSHLQLLAQRHVKASFPDPQCCPPSEAQAAASPPPPQTGSSGSRCFPRPSTVPFAVRQHGLGCIRREAPRQAAAGPTTSGPAAHPPGGPAAAGRQRGWHGTGAADGQHRGWGMPPAPRWRSSFLPSLLPSIPCDRRLLGGTGAALLAASWTRLGPATPSAGKAARTLSGPDSRGPTVGLLGELAACRGRTSALRHLEGAQPWRMDL